MFIQYQLISAYGILKSSLDWSEITDANLILVKDLFSQYRECQLKLKRMSDNKLMYLDLMTLFNSHQKYLYTLEVLLNNLPDKPNMWASDWVMDRLSYIRYCDLYQAGYSVKYARVGFNQLSNLQVEEKEDMEITSYIPSNDPVLLKKHAILSVNGLLHLSYISNSKLYLLNGGISAQYDQDPPSLGIYSIPSQYTLETRAIAEEDIVPMDRLKLYNACLIKVPEATEDDLILLSIGGYLYLPDYPSLKRISDNILKLRLSSSQFLSRCIKNQQLYFHDTEVLQNNGGISTDQVKSDQVVRELLLSPMSFVIIIRKAKMVSNTIPLRETAIPYNFSTVIEPIYPMMAGHGELVEYWKTYDEGIWGLETRRISHGSYLNLDYEKRYSGVTNAIYPGFKHMQASLIKLGLY